MKNSVDTVCDIKVAQTWSLISIPDHVEGVIERLERFFVFFCLCVESSCWPSSFFLMSKVTDPLIAQLQDSSPTGRGRRHRRMNSQSTLDGGSLAQPLLQDFNVGAQHASSSTLFVNALDDSDDHHHHYDDGSSKTRWSSWCCCVSKRTKKWLAYCGAFWVLVVVLFGLLTWFVFLPKYVEGQMQQVQLRVHDIRMDALKSEGFQVWMNYSLVDLPSMYAQFLDDHHPISHDVVDTRPR